MKALSVRQPWAGLIVAGIKDVENRSWSTSYRGRIAVHAAKAVDRRALLKFKTDRRWKAQLPGGALPSECEVLGALIGTVTVVDCRTRYDVAAPSVWHEDGRIGLYLSAPEVFAAPVPWKGQLGLFEVDDAAIGRVATYRPAHATTPAHE